MHQPAKWFVPVVVLALLWNLLGLAAVIMNLLLTPEQIAALPSEQQAMISHSPDWLPYASLVAVVAGTLGCLALLLKKSAATALFVVSLVGIIAQDAGILMVMNKLNAYATVPLVMQGLVLIIAIALILLSKKAKAADWLG
ncbi:hypothetical protein [Alteromonas flava]|uniref:hypothetical protein n=1 Tax=Alteromonas flava TaxID=2048003 RepID=UPI000C28D565|nr:hypothetical protein [Alteromonas flava]